MSGPGPSAVALAGLQSAAHLPTMCALRIPGRKRAPRRQGPSPVRPRFPQQLEGCSPHHRCATNSCRRSEVAKGTDSFHCKASPSQPFPLCTQETRAAWRHGHIGASLSTGGSAEWRSPSTGRAAGPGRAAPESTHLHRVRTPWGERGPVWRLEPPKFIPGQQVQPICPLTSWGN